MDLRAAGPVDGSQSPVPSQTSIQPSSDPKLKNLENDSPSDSEEDEVIGQSSVSLFALYFVVIVGSVDHGHEDETISVKITDTFRCQWVDFGSRLYKIRVFEF